MLNRNLKQFFWDIDFAGLDVEKNRDFIICRLAEKGGLNEFNWLKKTFDLQNLKDIIRNSRNVSVKTKNFWSVI